MGYARRLWRPELPEHVIRFGGAFAPLFIQGKTMITTKFILPISLSLISFLFVSTASASNEIPLTPLRANLIDAAEQYHQQQDAFRRNNPTKLVRIQYYLLKTKSQLPKALSQQLTLQDIKHDQQTVFHHYRLPNYQSQDKLNNSITRLTRLLALKDSCKKGSLSEHILQSNIDIVFYIRDKNGETLLEETMRLSDCQG